MKIVLTQAELTEVIKAHYPALAGYEVSDVSMGQRYSADFCTIELAAKADMDAERAP